MTETKTLNSVNKALKEKFKGKKLVFGRGAPGAKVVVVSEMLDAHGEKDGRPVGGPHVKMLNALLKQAGISPTKVYVTNVVKYRPDPEHMPTPKEIKSHATFLKEEIRTVNPDFVVTLGNLALNGVGLRIPVENIHGRTFPLGTYRLLPTFHPDRALKDPTTKILLEQDFAKLKELMKLPKVEAN
jgi:uracil-DNA glycosylase